MGRLNAVWHALAAKHERNDLLFGVVCMAVGGFALVLSWVAFRGPSDRAPELVGMTVHSNSGLSVEVVPDPDGLPPAPVPLHKRSDYQVESPDILSIQFADADERSRDDDMQTTGRQRLVETDGTIELGNELGSLHVEGLTTREIETAIEERAHAQGRNWRAQVSVYAQNSKVYYLIVEGEASHSTDHVQRHTVIGNETVAEALSRIEPSEDLQKKQIFIARAQPDGNAGEALPVEFEADSNQVAWNTNHEIQPGDRIFVAERAWWQQLLEKAATMYRDGAGEEPREASHSLTTSPGKAFPGL